MSATRTSLPTWAVATIGILVLLLGFQTARLYRTEHLYEQAVATQKGNVAIARVQPVLGSGKVSSDAHRVLPSSVAVAKSQRRVAGLLKPVPDVSHDAPRPDALPERRNPMDKEQILAQVKQYMDAGDTAHAEATLNQAVHDDPANAQLFRSKLAELYRNAGMTEQEAQLYADWIREDPDNPEPHLRLANLYNQLGERDQALAEVARYQHLSSRDPSLFPVAAALYREMGMEVEEGSALEAWAAESPGSLEAHRALGEFYRRTHDDQAALAEYQRAAQQFPGSADIRRELARAYEREGLEEEARAELEAALSLRSGDPRILMPLGDSYRRSGDLTMALQIYQTVMDTYPGTRDAEHAARNIERINNPPPPRPGDPKPKVRTLEAPVIEG